jgi:hypothetical protein
MQCKLQTIGWCEVKGENKKSHVKNNSYSFGYVGVRRWIPKAITTLGMNERPPPHNFGPV